MKVGIIGVGEVGLAIEKLVGQKHTTYTKDLQFDHLLNHQIDILHVCIPFGPKFVSEIISVINKNQPDLVIINSTVAPGTSQLIYQNTQVNIVHAPIIGVHPHLYEYLFKFTKPIGPVNQASFDLAKKHFNNLGVQVERFDSPLDTELGKLMCTTYYGWVILFEKWIHQICLQTGANYDQVYTRFNQIYNQGYARDLPHVVRPVIQHRDGGIGGHCVIPNTEIIDAWLNDPFAKFILAQNQQFAKKSNKE